MSVLAIFFWAEIWARVSLALCTRHLTGEQKEFMPSKKYLNQQLSPIGWLTSSYSKSKFNNSATTPTFCHCMEFSTIRTMSTFYCNTWKRGHYFCIWRKTQLLIKNKLRPKSNKSHRPFNICMKMELPIGTLNLKTSLCRMEYVNYAILDGLPFVTREEKHIAVRLIMQPHKFWKENNTICQ